MYIPTQISGVSVYHNRQSSRDGGFHSETENFKIRIPISALIQGSRTYLPETHYDVLTDEEAMNHWTLHNEDLVIVCLPSFIGTIFPAPVTRQEVEEISATAAIQKELIQIVDYADNTVRGSRFVRHWRIGGA